MEKYLLSNSAHEKMWTKEFAKPCYCQLFFCKSKELIQPQEQIRLLELFDTLVLFIVPAQTNYILRHPDLSLSNVFIDPQCKNIVGIIDFQARYRYIQKLAYHLYTIATAKFNPAHFHALRQKFLPIHHELIRQASLPWDGELLSLQCALIHFTETLNEPCPVSFVDEEKLAWKEGDECDSACSDLIDLHNMLGIEVQGWIPNDQFDEVMLDN